MHKIMTCVWTEGPVQLCDVEERSLNAPVAFGSGPLREHLAGGDPDPGTLCEECSSPQEADFTSAHLALSAAVRRGR